MPYRRRRPVRRRRVIRKRSMRRRMYKRSNYSKPDGNHSEKITRNHYLVVDALGTSAQFMANWYATGVPGAGEAYFTGGAANTNTQFQQCATMYKEFKVTGLKIQYKPTWFDSGGAASAIYTGRSGTVMNNIGGYPVATNLIVGSLDMKTFDAQKSFSRFYKVSKWAKGQSFVTWRSAQDAIVGLAGGYNTLPNCQTVLDVTSQGLGAGTQMAEIFVTYYVKFRIRTRA